jgi:hypothetical protein
MGNCLQSWSDFEAEQDGSAQWQAQARQEHLTQEMASRINILEAERRRCARSLAHIGKEIRTNLMHSTMTEESKKIFLLPLMKRMDKEQECAKRTEHKLELYRGLLEGTKNRRDAIEETKWLKQWSAHAASSLPDHKDVDQLMDDQDDTREHLEHVSEVNDELAALHDVPLVPVSAVSTAEIDYDARLKQLQNEYSSSKSKSNNNNKQQRAVKKKKKGMMTLSLA